MAPLVGEWETPHGPEVTQRRVRPDPPSWATPASARVYFAVQALAGACWWVAVFTSHRVRMWTLGGWNPKVLVAPDIALFVFASMLVAVRANRWIAALVAAWTMVVTVALAVYGLAQQRAGWGVLAMVIASVASVVATVTIWFGRLPLEWFFLGPFRFREAGAASTARHLRRSLSQLIVFWTAFFVLIPLVVTVVERRLGVRWIALDQPAFDALGASLFVVGCALGLWSCCTMAVRGRGTPLPAATARDLVIAGPYRYVRNPMAVAGALQTAALGLWLGSWIVIVLAVAGAVAWHLIIRPTEEADLAARFGEPYHRYRTTVRVWIPSGSGSRGRTNMV